MKISLVLGREGSNTDGWWVYLVSFIHIRARIGGKKKLAKICPSTETVDNKNTLIGRLHGYSHEEAIMVTKGGA